MNKSATLALIFAWNCNPWAVAPSTPSSSSTGTTPTATTAVTTATPGLDSDGDGYTDADELYEGTDPYEYDSRIYTGFWPYWRDKDTLTAPPFSGRLDVGDVFPRARAVDQYGETVDLYDYAGPDQDHRFLVISAAAAWAPPCVNLDDWLAGNSDVYGLNTTHGDVVSAVDQGELAWVTVLSQDLTGQPARVDDVVSWAEDHQHDRIAVLEDPDGNIEDAIVGTTGAWPSAALVRADTMEIVAIDVTIPYLLDACQARL